MSRQTNTFQKLIFLLEEQLQGPSGHVTEPAIYITASGTKRETDILIEVMVSGIPVRIAIECRDRDRKDTLEWIDGLKGKYDRTVNKVIAVSSSGFSDDARKEAEAAGILLLTLEEACNQDWVRTVEHFRFTLITCYLEDLAFTVGFTDLEARKVDSRASTVDKEKLYIDRKSIGTIYEYFESHLDHPVIRAGLINCKDGPFEIKIPTPPGTYLRGSKAKKHPVGGISVRGTLRHASEEVTPTAGRYRDNDVAHASLDQGKLVVAMSRNGTNITASIAPLPRKAGDGVLLSHISIIEKPAGE